MHQGWAAYLDAIHQNERLGYMYDQAVKQLAQQVENIRLLADAARPSKRSDTSPHSREH